MWLFQLFHWLSSRACMSANVLGAGPLRPRQVHHVVPTPWGYVHIDLVQTIEINKYLGSTRKSDDYIDCRPPIPSPFWGVCDYCTHHCHRNVVEGELHFCPLYDTSRNSALYCIWKNPPLIRTIAL